MAMVHQRPGGQMVASKRQRGDAQLMTMKQKPKRYSELQAPTMKLEGHAGEIFSMKFASHGVHLATASRDRMVFIWEVHGDAIHKTTLKGHKNAVLEVHWSTDDQTIFSASADKTVAAWDVQSGARIKKVVGHNSFVNSCCPARRGPPLFVSGSDDGTAKLWDLRAARHCVVTFPHKYQVTSVCFSDQSDQVFTGSLDNEVKCWDIRAARAAPEGHEPLYRLQAHKDTITGMALSPDGKFLLSNSMDNTAMIWDVSPFVAGGQRLAKVLGGQGVAGHVHGMDKLLLKCGWSPDGTMVGVGSEDRMVYVYDVATRAIKYRLPGHNGAVTEVCFHPDEPIIGSCSTDKAIFLGEIEKPWNKATMA